MLKRVPSYWFQTAKALPAESNATLAEPAGGVRVTGADGTTYVCNGASGTAGQPGTSVSVSPEAAGARCATGGVAVTSENRTTYVCNGTNHDPAELADLEARVKSVEDVVFARRVFITSLTYTGNLGGVAGANTQCQSRADAAVLGGTWRAWISTSTTPASSNLAHSTLPYVLLSTAALYCFEQ